MQTGCAFSSCSKCQGPFCKLLGVRLETSRADVGLRGRRELFYEVSIPEIFLNSGRGLFH